SPTSAPVSGLRSGAHEGSVRMAKMTSSATSPRTAYRSPRDSSLDAVSPLSTEASPVYLPSLGSMTLSVTNATTNVSMMTETTENQKLAARSIERDGSRMWMASLVISVRIPSSGLMRMFTLNTAATP